MAPSAPLRYWRLIEVGPGASLTLSPLRLDERMLHYLTGTDARDDRLPVLRLRSAHLAEWNVAAPDRVLVKELAQAWASDDCPVVQLHGGHAERRRVMVRAASERLGIDPVVIAAAALPQEAAELKHLVRLWDKGGAAAGMRSGGRSDRPRYGAAC